MSVSRRNWHGHRHETWRIPVNVTEGERTGPARKALGTAPDCGANGKVVLWVAGIRARIMSHCRAAK